jgi:hypothetical protein
MDSTKLVLTEDLSLQLLGDTEFKIIISELDQLFPDVCQEHTLSNEEKCYRFGQVSVVRYLKSKLRH